MTRALSGSRADAPSQSSLSRPIGFDPGQRAAAVRELRSIFKPAYHVWRDEAHRNQTDCECGNGIPWDGNELLDLLVLDLERALARKETA